MKRVKVMPASSLVGLAGAFLWRLPLLVATSSGLFRHPLQSGCKRSDDRTSARLQRRIRVERQRVGELRVAVVGADGIEPSTPRV